jgi:hypothetical protein
MIHSMKMGIYIFVTAFGLQSFAGTLPLLELNNILESTAKPNYPGSEISVEVDEQGNLLGLIYGGKNEAPHKKQFFDLQALNSRTGAILEADHSALVLFGNHVDKAQGGTVSLRHIYNGILGTYHHCPAQIRKTTQGQWAFIPEGTATPITSATLVVYSIGIRDIRGLHCR